MFPALLCKGKIRLGRENSSRMVLVKYSYKFFKKKVDLISYKFFKKKVVKGEEIFINQIANNEHFTTHCEGIWNICFELTRLNYFHWASNWSVNFI